MTDQKEEMNTDGNNDCYLLRSPTPEDQHGQQGARNGYKFHRAISPFRTTLEKVLVVVTFILFIVCIVFVVLFAVEKSKASESVSNSDVVYDEYKGKRIYITSVCTQTRLPPAVPIIFSSYPFHFWSATHCLCAIRSRLLLCVILTLVTRWDSPG